MARRMPEVASVSTSPGVAVLRNALTSREDAGRRRGSSTRSMINRKAMRSGGKRMTLRATTENLLCLEVGGDGPVGDGSRIAGRA
jgi:hypothetical protein